MTRPGITSTLLACLACASACSNSGDPDDPVANDPGTIDRDHPPALVELNFDSHGKRLNGIMYLANGRGPHPVVILLHGFPGNEKNLDLAQALRRAGYNVLFFHYRGAWGSEGTYRFTHVIEDVASAVRMVRARAPDYRSDPERIILAGHSMGGFAALQAAARAPSIRCVAGIASWDPAVDAAAIVSNPDAAVELTEYIDSADMLAGADGAAMVDEVLRNAESFSLRGLAPSLAGKTVLLLAGAQDEAVPPVAHHDPAVAAFAATADITLTARVIPGDHAFSWSRIELIREVLAWMENCDAA